MSYTFPDAPINATTSTPDAGLTIRQHFAAVAMHGILSNEDLRKACLSDRQIDGTTNENYIVNYAVKQADALIKELNRPL